MDKKQITFEKQTIDTLKVISKITEILMINDASDEAIPQVLRALGEKFKVSRVTIFKIHPKDDGETIISLFDTWINANSPKNAVIADIGKIPIITSGSIPFIEKLSENRVVSGLTRHLPESERVIPESLNILSFCDVPIFIDDVFWGFIGFVDCISERLWNEIETETLQVVANILANYFKLTSSKKALIESEEKFKNIYNNSTIGLYRTTVDGRIIMANPTLAGKLGYDNVEELKQIDLNETERSKRNRRQEFLDIMMKYGYVIGHETKWTKRDGTMIDIRENSQAIKDVHGNILYFEGSIEDITEQKKAEEQLIKAQKLESVGTLAGGIAHDFNNLLTGILGNIALAKLEIETDNEAFVCLNEAEMAAMHARDLTNQLLTFSTGGKPVLKPLQLKDLITQSTNLIVKSGNINPIFQIDENLYPAEIDKGLFRQVFYNTIINAEQAMPNGGTIKVIAENCTLRQDDVPTLQEGKYIKVTIIDEGVGIPQKNIAKVFDPYYTTKQTGSGLGLATTFSIIKKHNGYINIDSVLGEGTTVTFYLPAYLNEISLFDTVDGRKEEKVIRKNKGRILVMDDEDFIRTLATRVLTRAGFEVEAVEDGEQALMLFETDLLKKKYFDAVILDLTVPAGMGGQETIERLKKFDPNIKAIVCSGYSNDPVMSFYTQYGFDSVITKPYSPSDLIDAVNSLLNDHPLT